MGLCIWVDTADHNVGRHPYRHLNRVVESVLLCGLSGVWSVRYVCCAVKVGCGVSDMLWAVCGGMWGVDPTRCGSPPFSTRHQISPFVSTCYH